LPLSAGATNSAITRSGVGDAPGAAIVNETVSPDWAIVSGAWVTAADAAGAATATTARPAASAAGNLYDL
jgi:hypothetical protein